MQEVNEAAAENEAQLGTKGTIIKTVCMPLAGTMMEWVAERGVQYALSRAVDTVRAKLGDFPADLLAPVLGSLWSTYGAGISAMKAEQASRAICPIVAHWIELKLQ